MTKQERIQQLDEIATAAVEKIGVQVGDHEFRIKTEDADLNEKTPGKRVYYLNEKEIIDDVNPVLGAMGRILYFDYIDYEIDWEPDMDRIYFISESLQKAIDDLRKLGELGVPADITFEGHYTRGETPAEKVKLVLCRCETKIQVEEGEPDEIECPYCKLPFHYDGEHAEHGYGKGIRTIIEDYKPRYDL